MNRVLMIAGVIVLLLGTVALWLSIEPPTERSAVATGTSSRQQEMPPSKAKTNSDTGEMAPQPTQSTPSRAPEPEKDTGFRPITETRSDPDRPLDDAAGSSSKSTAPNSSGNEQGSSGTSPDGPSLEPSMHASSVESGETPVLPPKRNLGPAVQSPDRKAEPTANTIQPPADHVAPTPKPAQSATIAENQFETRQPSPEPIPVPDHVASKKRAPHRRRGERPPAPPGRYETTTTATARAQPKDTGPMIDKIRRGTILNVTGSEGDWLVVYSKQKNITVYVRRDEAMLSRRPPPLSTDVPESRWPNVEQAIRQAFVRNNVVGIQATFIGDTAYLKGTVKSDRERERAEIFARSVLEVKHVFNGIRVE